MDYKYRKLDKYFLVKNNTGFLDNLWDLGKRFVCLT